MFPRHRPLKGYAAQLVRLNLLRDPRSKAEQSSQQDVRACLISREADRCTVILPPSGAYGRDAVFAPDSAVRILRIADIAPLPEAATQALRTAPRSEKSEKAEKTETTPMREADEFAGLAVRWELYGVPPTPDTEYILRSDLKDGDDRRLVTPAESREYRHARFDFSCA